MTVNLWFEHLQHVDDTHSIESCNVLFNIGKNWWDKAQNNWIKCGWFWLGVAWSVLFVLVCVGVFLVCFGVFKCVLVRLGVYWCVLGVVFEHLFEAPFPVKQRNLCWHMNGKRAFHLVSFEWCCFVLLWEKRETRETRDTRGRQGRQWRQEGDKEDEGDKNDWLAWLAGCAPWSFRCSICSFWKSR